MRPFLALLLCALAGAWSDARLVAQVFAESFDAVGPDTGAGPAGLLAKGFQFRTVASPGVGHQPWKQGPWHAGQPAAWQGAGFLSQGVDIPPAGVFDFAEWIILPPIVGLSAGHVASFWCRGFVGPFPAQNSVELLYSPTGGTATGSTTTSVGDFTVVLAGNSNATNNWDHVQVVVPGGGRLAIRWHSTFATTFPGTVGDCLIDDFTVTSGGVTPLLPQPGQTVHWTTAMSPVHLINQQIVPAGATLVIDAGVTVFFDATTPVSAGPEMRADGGTIRLAGVPGNPVVLRRGANTTEVPRIGVVLGGVLEADFVDSMVSFITGLKSRVVVRNSALYRTTPIDWASSTDSQYQVPTILIWQSTGVVTNCVIGNAICSVKDGFVRVEGNTFVDALLAFDRSPISQPASIDGNTFYGSDERAPLSLDGYDYHLGPGNQFGGNARPVDLFGAGLTRDSVVPATGNVANVIRLHGSAYSEIKGPMTLPALAVPYSVPQTITAGNQYDPSVRILPGAVLEMGPQAGLLFEGVARIDVRGTPEQPVHFKRSVPGVAWRSFTTASSPPVIVRNALFEGADWALGTTDAQFVAHDCTFTGNAEGIRVGDLGLAYVSRCRFSDNAVGINVPWAGLSGIDLGHVYGYGAGNDSSFEGPGQGIVVDPTQWDPYAMENAWWGHASGPTTSTNPGGSGQPVVGVVDVTPFRTTPVDFSNHPPVVDALPVARGRLLRPGSKILLHWSARDEAGIVAQRLEYRGARGMADSIVVLPSISPLARSVEVTIPDTQNNPPPGWPGDQGLAVFRIVAVDAESQEGFDDFHWSVAPGPTLPVTFTTVLSGGFEVGESFDLATTVGGTSFFTLFLDDLPRDMQPLGAGGPVLSSGPNTMPAVSTDLARYAISLPGGLLYSPYFSIRPSTALGDAPPVVVLTSPADDGYTGGSVVPITWSASDDSRLRSFDLQASYDGVTWHPFAEDLPGTTTHYAWQLPASTGIDDVRIRVVARDTLFQVSSSSSAPFDIKPGGSAWRDLGHSLAGLHGAPHLTGMGSPSAGLPFVLTLASAKPNEPLTVLVVGLHGVFAPVFGGVLVPAPDFILSPIATQAHGGWSLPAPWLVGLPSGMELAFQTWIVDPSGPAGFTVSNGLGYVVP